VSFVDRPYPDIVRDVLTTLTQGVAREVHRIDYDPLARPLQVPDVVLLRRPVRRVSAVEGFISGPTPEAEIVKHVFTLKDYELAPNPDDPDDLSRIRFLPFGKKPAHDTDLVVNYYPRTTDPTPITDLNVGSVARTILEAVSKELALLYAQLNLAYDSAFLETASGSSLDRVVALLGYNRFRAGRPVGTVTFTRRPGAIGSITIPAGTPITDTSDKIRYETVETREMLAGESTAQIAVRGATASTPVVEAGVLSVIQRAIAGLERVTNERPTTRASDDETDVELRARTRDALLRSNKGTVSAIQHGLLQLPEVRDVKILEMPNGVPGEISIAVSLAQPTAHGTLPRAVLARIEELRPAGIRVLSASAATIPLQASLQLTLAGNHLSSAEVTQIHRAAQQTLVAEVGQRGVGEKIRNRALTASILDDDRIVDAIITLKVKDGAAAAPGEDFQPDAGASVQLLPENVSFAADQFDKPLDVNERIAVDVRASVPAEPVPGVPIAAVKTEVETRLKAFFDNLSAGTSIDIAAILTALRSDTRYAIDPLKLRVTLTAADQFVQITQGGALFTVQPQQTFNIASVELSS
jgi:uncharacterized phage protein gp47/JayE